MDFVSNREFQQQEMLQAIGVKDIKELFNSVPTSLILPAPQIDDGISEYEGLRLMESLAAKNTCADFDNYLGAGAYEHHVPALAGAVCSKSEFLTSYTPYQAEVSQGMLQAIFEFQSAVCLLTGMEVANASVYDGASACAEAVLMALRIKNDRSKVLLSGALNPLYRAVVNQYIERHPVDLKTLPIKEGGTLNIEAALQSIDSETACILIQSPNFFGLIEESSSIISKAKAHGVLVLLCANPIAYGLFKSAGEQDADIAVGDCQPFGVPLEFGGPYIGYMACKREWVRQLPGRLVGETKDQKGRTGYILTLQAREQHIRREKATSNICTNQALAALANLVTMLWYGPEGIKQLALTNYQRATYLREELGKLKGVKIVSSGTHFNEFAVRFDLPLEKVLKHFRSHNIEPGVVLERFYSAMKNTLLVAVTETKSLDQLDGYVQVVKGLYANGI